MTKRRRRLAIALAIAGALIASVVFAAGAFLPSWLRGTIERVASEAVGRDLRIAGPFELSWSLAPKITAGDITLANARWGSEPFMIRVERASLSVELASLWSGPVRVRGLEIENARVLLEANDAGRGNWTFDTRPAPGRPAERPARSPVVFDHLAIRGFELDYRGRPDARAVVLGVTELTARLDPADGMIDLRGAGRFNDASWEIGARLGTLDHLYVGRDLEQTLTGRVGASRITLRGHIGDPLELGDPDVELDVDGPDIEAALATFGLRSPLTGPFQLKGRLGPGERGVAFDLRAALGGTTATARGSVAALLAPGVLEATVDVAGPDASAAGRWISVNGLPPRPFAASGHVRLDEKRTIALEGVKLRVGGSSAEVNGVVGRPPRCVGTSLAIVGQGKDLSEFSALTRVRLPARPFHIRGRFVRGEDGLAIDGVDARIADASVQAAGTIGEPPRLANLDMTLEASGPDLSWLSEVAIVNLPEEPFVLRGRIARHGTALDLESVAGRLGDIGLNLSGRLVPAKRLEGTDVQVHVAGPDIARLASRAGLRGVPAQPFDVKGRVRVVPGGYELEDVAARSGRLEVTGAGRLGVPPTLEGTVLNGRADGPALSDLSAWGLPAMLPADPFSVSGTVRVKDGDTLLERMVADVGGDELRVDGTLGPAPDLSRVDVSVSASGPALDRLGRFFPAWGAAPPERLPPEPYVISGRLRRVAGGVELRDARAKAGNVELRAEGTVGTGHASLGTNLWFDAVATDMSLLAAMAGHALPAGRFEAHGRLARTEAGVLCDGVTVAVGSSRAAISGTVGERPNLAGTDLKVDVSGPDLAALVAPFLDHASLPPDPFDVSAHLEGSVERLAADSFVAHLGGSDLEGSVSIHLDGRPAVEADLRSKLLDVPALLHGLEEDAGTVPAAPGAKSKPERRKGERVISGQPLPFDVLRTVDATVHLQAAEVRVPGVPLRDVVVAGALRDGALRLNRIEGTEAYGGRATVHLSLEPDGDAYRLRTKGRLDGARLVLAKTATAPETWPSLDVEFEVEGRGRSLHDLAASAGGGVLVILGPGRIPNTLNDVVSSGVTLGLLDALNPFRKSSPYTQFECGIAAAEIVSGTAVVEPIATRTDKLTVVGRGKVDFATEGIELVWTLKPRRGIGLSAGSIANPYIKLSGTLAAPRLDVKPLEAAASTGAAVATAGLTVFFRGIYNRITAEKNVCVDALAKARRQIETRKAADSHPVPSGGTSP